MERPLFDIIDVLDKHQYELGLSYIDEDFGQLEAIDSTEDTYPITFPAVLVESQVTTWDNLGGKEQTGATNIVVKVLIDCYDDTHANSRRTHKILDRSKLVHNVTKLLHHLPICHNKGVLTRTTSTSYNGPHLIKVYETTYTCQFVETFADEQMSVKPAIKIIT